jgi:hypothetical protein
MENKMLSASAKFFEKNGWVKIESFIDFNISQILYTYVTLEAERLNYLENNEIEKNTELYGTFNDKQAPGDFSKYGDLIFDTLLILGLEKISALIEKKLIPTYSYHRLYTTGTELKKHKDRPSCEISTTLCLGYDASNVDAKKYPDWDWPMFVKTKEGEELPIHLKPGDMIIYRGCEIEHWREPFWGLNHAQVFLHYNEKNGDYNNLYDDRPMLGLPSSFKNNLNKKIIF